MKLIKRNDVRQKPLPGRVLQLLVGKEDAVVPSTVMTMGFAHYSADSGPMQPHHHAEEVVYILESNHGWVRFGDDPERLSDRIELKPGMTLHFPEMEWHVFEYDEGGHIDIIFYYSQSDVYSARPGASR